VKRFPEIDLANPDHFVSGTPHHWFKQLRAEAPVYFHPESDGGPGFWCITKYEDLKHISRNPKIFSSWLGGTNIPDQPEESMAGLRAIMLNMDPPQHVKFRRTVQRSFTPKLMESMRPHVRELARRIVDQVAPKGECEFVEDLAAELPLQVICEMMGVPHDDRKQIFDWSNQLIGFDDPEYQTNPADAMQASAQMFGYAMQLAAKRLARPGDDLVTRLLTSEVDGHKLSELEFSSFFLLLAIAGNETTRTVTCWGMHSLITHPDQREKVLRSPVLLESAVEEILRFAPAVHYFRRTTTEDTEIRGQRIRKGEKVAMWYPSANRDEDVFPDANRFRVDRRPNPHVAFGIGNHFCLGANLARLELRSMLDELVRRLPDVELAPGTRPSYTDSPFVRGVASMPVVFTPEER